MNRKQAVDFRLKKQYGLHPFERLCEQCPLSDCYPTNKMCLQRKVLGEPPNNALSWRRMTEIMIDAGITSDLGDLPEIFGLDVKR